MKKLIITGLILGIGFIMVGCSNPKSTNKDIKNSRFQIIYSQDNEDGSIDIIKDTQTNKEYLWRKNGYGAGLTFLQ